MLSELPGLAERLKVFVRENPLKESACGEVPQSMAPLVADLFIKAAAASRQTFTYEVENTRLRLADLRSFENRLNTVALPQLPGIGPGLLRVVTFKTGRSWAAGLRRDSPMGMFVEIEHSPLGWPERPDMATADFNVLFEKPEEGEVEAQADAGWRSRESML